MGSFPRGARGGAVVNPRSPSAYGICDRSGFRVNHSALSWQFEWQGSQLQNTRLLVRSKSLDRPNEQLRAYAVPADPIPIRNPRPDLSDMTSGWMPYLEDENGNLVVDEFGHPIVVQQPSGPGQPPPPVSTLIPLVDDDGNIIRDDTGQIIYVDGGGSVAADGSGAPGGGTPAEQFKLDKSTLDGPDVLA